MTSNATQNISVICIGPDGCTDTQARLASVEMTTAYRFHRRWWEGVNLFHHDGNRYEVAAAEAARPLSVLSRVLATTVYNPQIAVRYEYRNCGPYRVDELRDSVAAAIDKDDDVLTQFHTADELKQRLDRALSFEDVADVLALAESESE